MSTQNTEHRSYTEPDEVREFPNGKAEILKVGGAEIGRLILQPGWRWSNDVKPIAGTDLCEAPHMQYHVSGRVHVVMGDGSEFEAGPVTSRRSPAARRLGGQRRAGRGRRLVRRQQLRPVGR